MPVLFQFQEEAGPLFPLNRLRDPMLPDLNDDKNRFVEDWLGGPAANGDGSDGLRHASDASTFLLMQMQDHHLTVW